MRFLRSCHWLVTCVLFLIAMALYLTGFGTGAAAIVFLGLVVEAAAWLSIAGHPTKPTGSRKNP